jgi:hypothetical protein
MSGTGRFAHLLGMLLADAAATITQATETSDAERIVLIGGRTLEKFAEDLVVPIDGEFEALLDERFLGADLMPPRTLELEDRLVTVGQVYSGDLHHL